MSNVTLNKPINPLNPQDLAGIKPKESNAEDTSWKEAGAGEGVKGSSDVLAGVEPKDVGQDTGKGAASAAAKASTTAAEKAVLGIGTGILSSQITGALNSGREGLSKTKDAGEKLASNQLKNAQGQQPEKTPPGKKENA